MSKELPEGWATSTLGEICSKPQYGWTCRGAKTGKTKYVRTTDISSGGISWETVPFCEEAPDDIEKYRVSPNDILVSRAGSVGVSLRIANVPYVAVFASYIIRFNALAGVDPKYVEFFLKSEDYWRAIAVFAAGIAVPNVNASKLGGLELPLPPLAEQRRIVAKLEELLGKVDGCRKRMAKIPVLLKRFRQSVLAAACSGRLTADWRERQEGVLMSDSELPSTWCLADLREIADVIDPNPSHRYPSYENGSVPILATEQMRGLDDWECSGAKLVNRAFYEERSAAHGFHRSDIVFARKGRLGLARRAPGIPRFVFSHTIFIVRAKDDRVSDYLLWFLRRESCVTWLLQEMNSNTGVPTLGKACMERLPIALPSLPEQHEIVRRVDALFALADQIEARYAKAKALVDRLTPSILAKAFRGELVPQDPNDEPASVLLERIREERLLRFARNDGRGRKERKIPKVAGARR